MKTKKRRHRSLAFYFVAGVFITIVVLGVLPVIFIVTSSMMGTQEIAARYGALNGISINTQAVKSFLSFQFLPQSFTFSQYYKALLRTPDFLNQFWNTIIILIPILVGNLLVSAMCGYALAKLNFPMRKGLLMLYMLMFLLPFQVTLVPNFLVLQRMGLIGTRLAIILPAMFNPFGAFLIHQFAQKLPESVFEMARIEGASEGTLFWRIALPQLAPGLCSLAVLTIIDVWSMTEQPLALLQTSDAMPLSVTLSSLTRTSPDIAFVCGTVFLIPLLMTFLIGKQYLVDGMADMVP